MTLRLPESVAERLRECSRTEGWSLNETAIHALRRGLGEPEAEPEEWWRVLGDLVEVPPKRRYDPEELRRFHATLRPSMSSIDEDLDWVRSDRDEPEPEWVRRWWNERGERGEG